MDEILGKSGYFLLVLHAHLPYVHHPEREEFLEERWFFEAMTETYIPLLETFEKLSKDGVEFKLVISFSPPLMEMMVNPSMQEKYGRHLRKLLELAEKEVERTREEDPRKHRMANFYRERFERALEIFENLDGNILAGFIELHKSGFLEIITCNATHAFLPLFREYPHVIDLQIGLAVEIYERLMGFPPNGMWIAECGFFPDLDSHLSKFGIKYFFLDTHGFTFSETPPRYGVYRPIMTPEGVFAFARDPQSSEQIWSAEIGYPGDFNYREFYRDIGFDREYDYIKPYIDKSGVRVNTGIKYHRITGKVDLSEKDLYDLDRAIETANNHAHDFLIKKREQVKYLQERFEGEIPIIVAPFDAELFGHWWFEGPWFLDKFFRLVSKDEILGTILPLDFLKLIDKVQIITPAQSSWGAKGFNDVWLNGKNDWIYPHLHKASERIIEILGILNRKDKLKMRAFTQMIREFLLAQASDWPFIMTTGTSVEYAVRRIKRHIGRFNRIYESLKGNGIDVNELERYELLDDIFSEISHEDILRILEGGK